MSRTPPPAGGKLPAPPSGSTYEKLMLATVRLVGETATLPGLGVLPSPAECEL